MHLCAGTHRGQKRVSGPLEQVEAGISHPICMLWTKLVFSGKAGSALLSQLPIPDPLPFF